MGEYLHARHPLCVFDRSGLSRVGHVYLMSYIDNIESIRLRRDIRYNFRVQQVAKLSRNQGVPPARAEA